MEAGWPDAHPVRRSLRNAAVVTSMQSHARRHDHALRPGIVGERTLDLCCSDDRVDGVRKGDEEAVTLRVHFTAIMRPEDRLEQRPILSEHVTVARAEAL